MKTKLSLLLAMLAPILSAGEALGQSYICDKMPMYPVGGGQWMHYALVYDASCLSSYPTGHVDDYAQSSENCPDGCDALTGAPTVISNPDVYLKDVPQPPSAFNGANACRDYLVFQAPSLPGSKYNQFNYVRRGYVELTRPDGSSFYAVVFRMTGSGAGRRVHLGFEIDASGGGPLTPMLTNHGTWNAVHHATGVPPEPINGLLKVQLHPNAAVNDVAYIRIFASEENLASPFPVEPLPDPAEFARSAAAATGGDACSPSPTCPQCSQWCYRPQCWDCRPRRGRGRCR